MKKTFLLSYKAPNFFTLSDWTHYKLYLETVYFWGLFKTKKGITYKVYDNQIKSFHEHWDYLIKNRLHLKLS